MDDEYRAQLEEQLRMERQLLHGDKMIEARAGLYCDPSVTIRIGSREKVIADLESRLGIAWPPVPHARRAEIPLGDYMHGRRAEPPPPRYRPESDLAQQHGADVAHQIKLLGIHRANLAHYQQQARVFGGIAYAPPIVPNSIRSAVEEIARLKRVLHGYGVVVEDLAGDV